MYEVRHQAFLSPQALELTHTKIQTSEAEGDTTASKEGRGLGAGVETGVGQGAEGGKLTSMILFLIPRGKF